MKGKDNLLVSGYLKTYKGAAKRGLRIVKQADSTGIHPQWYLPCVVKG